MSALIELNVVRDDSWGTHLAYVCHHGLL